MNKTFGKISKIHFVGIGGIGMSGIAEILHNMGFIVTGSDISESLNTNYLTSKGIKVYIGHDKEHAAGADVLVYSTAIKENNPEIIYAKEHYIPVIKRGEMLAELMRMKYSIAISGSHGKTTTSSMIAEIFNYAKLDPTVIIGGRLNRNKANASYGLSHFMISEADESDKSFLLLYPTITVVTNIDREHFETYRNIREIKEAFIEFNNKIPFYGFNVLCLDDFNTADIIPYLKRRFITYGIKASADVKAMNVKLCNFGSRFDVSYQGTLLGQITLKVPGIHNILNALAAVITGIENEIDFNEIRDALKAFEGVGRRLTVRLKNEHLVIIDDYAHHPAEIQASIKALRESFPGYELVVIFQPHRYTRVKHLMNLFSKSFFDVDKLYVTDIYPACEEPIIGVHSIVLVDQIKKHGLKNVFYLKNVDDFLDIAPCYFNDKTVIVTMGAGDITRFSYTLTDIAADKLNCERFN